VPLVTVIESVDVKQVIGFIVKSIEVKSLNEEPSDQVIDPVNVIM